MGTMIPFGETGYDMWMVALINMARDKVLWVGPAGGGGGAATSHVAEAALALIEVDYEPLPAVMDFEAAWQPMLPGPARARRHQGRRAATARRRATSARAR